MEACLAIVIVFVVIFAILGIAYSFLAATMAIQRIWQRHYHILTKRELTKVGTGFPALSLYTHGHGHQLNGELVIMGGFFDGSCEVPLLIARLSIGLF